MIIGKQKKPILFKVTGPSSIPYRTHPACAERAAYSDPLATLRVRIVRRVSLIHLLSILVTPWLWLMTIPGLFA